MLCYHVGRELVDNGNVDKHCVVSWSSMWSQVLKGLKSVVRKDVRVRLPPSAPPSTFATTTTCIVLRNCLVRAALREMRER